MKKLFLASALGCLAFSTQVFAEETAAAPSMTMQIVQDQFVLDAASISNAIIVEPEHHYQGVHIELTPLAARKLAAMTSDSVGKKINVILNDKVVSTNVIKTVIDNHVLITGMSYDEAQRFVDAIKDIHARQVKKPAVAMADVFESMRTKPATSSMPAPVEASPFAQEKSAAVASNDTGAAKEDAFEVAAGLNAPVKEENTVTPMTGSEAPATGPQLAQNDDVTIDQFNDKDFIVQE